MKLKFIGQENSLGLIYGKVYNVTIGSKRSYMYVEIYNHNGSMVCLPYFTIEKFTQDWTDCNCYDNLSVYRRGRI
jgi:hypothetical protein